MQQMLADGVSTRRGVMNAHLEPAYGAHRRHDLRASELAQDRGIILPLVPGMSDDQIAYVCDSLAAALRNA